MLFLPLHMIFCFSPRQGSFSVKMLAYLKPNSLTCSPITMSYGYAKIYTYFGAGYTNTPKFHGNKIPASLLKVEGSFFFLVAHFLGIGKR